MNAFARSLSLLSAIATAVACSDRPAPQVIAPSGGTGGLGGAPSLGAAASAGTAGAQANAGAPATNGGAGSIGGSGGALSNDMDAGDRDAPDADAGDARDSGEACALDPQRILDDIAYFASDECRGRIPGDIGNDRALAFAESELIAAGLAPAGDDGTYRQAFGFDCDPSDHCEGYAAGVAENVLAKIEGSDPVLARDVIIIGAHIDHLGFEGDDIYRGADDNASGAAVVLELARMFKRCGLAPKRTLLFVEWNAEEMGLLGSRHYVDHPALPLDRTIAVYNFDMVGSGDGTGVLLFGGDDDNNRWLTDLMIDAAEASNLTHVIELVPQKLASDHAPFVARGIPVCWGFSRPDPHPGYHTPDDDISRIKLQSLRAVSELFWSVLRPLATAQANP